jgi:hypothetical protein
VADRLAPLSLGNEGLQTEGPSTASGDNVSEHTCIKDDGGTPGRRCYACEEETAAAGLKLSPDDVLDVYVPGRLRCPTCKFELTKATLFVKTGQIGASKAEVYQESEPCPNDGEPMVRVTWREEADANRAYAMKLIDEIIQATGANSLPEALQAAAAPRAGIPEDEYLRKELFIRAQLLGGAEDPRHPPTAELARKVRRERDLFLDALTRFGGHNVDCLVDGTKECTCGFSALLAGAGITVEFAESDRPPVPETLRLAWERFTEEQRHAQVEIGPARKSFYAGAQAFVGIVSAAMEDEEDVDAWQRLEAAYEELANACEELKI